MDIELVVEQQLAVLLDVSSQSSESCVFSIVSVMQIDGDYTVGVSAVVVV